MFINLDFKFSEIAYFPTILFIWWLVNIFIFSATQHIRCLSFSDPNDGGKMGQQLDSLMGHLLFHSTIPKCFTQEISIFLPCNHQLRKRTVCLVEL